MPLISRRPLKALFRSNFSMGGCRHTPVRSSAAAVVPLSYHRVLYSNNHPHLLSKTLQKPCPKSLFYSLKSSGFRSLGPVMLSRTVHTASTDSEARLAVLKSLLEEQGIQCGSCKPGQYSNMLCPECAGGISKERSLSLFIHEDGKLAMWSCFRGKCGWKGHVKDNVILAPRPKKGKAYRDISKEELQLEPLCEELISYFATRMISAETLRRNDVMQREKHNKLYIAFTYKRDGDLIGCKYRGVDKNFWQESNTEKIFYGLDDMRQGSDIIIVEGEMDKLAMEEAGYPNCISVPDGAPAKVAKELPKEEQDKKFEYLWNCKSYTDKASRIILATDVDGPGQALAEELARRIGKERCWRVKWPMKNTTEICKDANEVLIYLGKDALKDVIEKAELYPIRGLFSFADFFHEIDDYYNGNHADELGVSTGWRAVDDVYMVMPGELTVVTGVPNSGKSEWIDALMCNINEKKGWSFVLCSMENKVRDHARKLLEKHAKKPFFNARYGESAERMNVTEFEQGKLWLDNTFSLIRCDNDCLPSIDWVLMLAKAAVLRYGARGLVIDPYNELDHQRPSSQTETEYVSQMLTKIRRFALHHSCHVWFVAHPRQLQNWSGGPPSMYDISGSAHFINKCDNGIVVHRNRDEKAGPIDQVQICVRKVRNKVAGRIGDAFLSYNRVTGEFMDLDQNTG